MAELHIQHAKDRARTAMGYVRAFEGRNINWQSPDPWPHRIELAQALEWIEELSAMTLNLAARIAELEAERDALKVDAERYRWLREGELLAEGDWPVAVEGHVSRRALWSEELDAAIDAAMNQPKEGQ